MQQLMWARQQRARHPIPYVYNYIPSRATNADPPRRPRSCPPRCIFSVGIAALLPPRLARPSPITSRSHTSTMGLNGTTGPGDAPAPTSGDWPRGDCCAPPSGDGSIDSGESLGDGACCAPFSPSGARLRAERVARDMSGEAQSGEQSLRGWERREGRGRKKP